jgi:hypothetical protein
MTLSVEFFTGLGLTIIPAVLVFVLSCWLGLFLSVAVSLWLLLCLAHLFEHSILFGSLVVLSMVGLLGHAGHLGCWLTTCS